MNPAAPVTRNFVTMSLPSEPSELVLQRCLPQIHTSRRLDAGGLYGKG